MHKLFKNGFLLLAVLLCTTVVAQTPQHYYVEIKTDKGTTTLKLYNETPLHRDNFVRLVRDGYYDSLLFHRVINQFMIQGGDPGSKFAVDKQSLGEGGPGYEVPAEILPTIFHKKGTIGAARDNNPEKKSSGSQFYLVQGRVFTPAGLDSLETMRLKKKLTPQQRETYTTVGGVPHLDGEYTVFGELINNLDVVDNIAKVETDDRDRPVKNERMAMRTLTRDEALQIELGEVPKPSFFKRIFSKAPSQEYTLEPKTK
ncbi:peptidylprolyl isomerase [Sphingobacterium corticis]|uniref:peptidylprolyl isomerase n=1 Tax=Sphingobacterium corticis TaxID=1812823 RepID=A0ABW5NGA2_9SPHI